MEDYKDIEFKEIDIEKDEDGEVLAEKYQVRSVPTTVLLDENDELIYKLMGNVPEKDFIDVINEALKDR
jgi:thioredoxin-related protein